MLSCNSLNTEGCHGPRITDGFIRSRISKGRVSELHLTTEKPQRLMAQLVRRGSCLGMAWSGFPVWCHHLRWVDINKIDFSSVPSRHIHMEKCGNTWPHAFEGHGSADANHVPLEMSDHFVLNSSRTSRVPARPSLGEGVGRSICAASESHCQTTCAKWKDNLQAMSSYLLGLLAMIKCSICSYQCDN